jgi:predicted pyridoxine 5'-phosphate oxidase superfamily flavin-nucleotide-binding protein
LSLRAGSAAEHCLQVELGTAGRAAGFSARPVRPHPTARMREFIAAQSMVFLASAGLGGACDASFRGGPRGFVRVLDDRTVACPEFRGNGVMASAASVLENPHLALLFIGFTTDRLGLHVNGSARLWSQESLRLVHPELPQEAAPGRKAQFWVVVTVEEAFVHCPRHIPRLQPPRDRPADDGRTAATSTVSGRGAGEGAGANPARLSAFTSKCTGRYT